MRWTRQRRRAEVSQGGFAVSEQQRAGRTAPKPGEASWRRRVAAYGKTVWSWHPLLVSSCRWRSRSDRIGMAIKPAATVTRRIRRRGEHGISRKTIAQGMPDASAEPVCSCACSLCTLHTRPRVQRAPGIPCSLIFSRDGIRAKLRAHRAARM
jgi:hypothetical protein